VAFVAAASGLWACGGPGTSGTSEAPKGGSSGATDAGSGGADATTGQGTGPDAGAVGPGRGADATAPASGDGAAIAPDGSSASITADGGPLPDCKPPAAPSNLFADVLGKSATDVQNKVNAAFQSLFHGGADATVYYEVGTDEAYILDVNDNDVRTEGMSYGMMIAVQLDKKTEFDRIWSWAKANMYQSSGPLAGFFSWHRTADGGAIGTSTFAAPDGEEYFATALILASMRWGNGTGIFDYASQARALLDVMVHKGEASDAQDAGVTSMFDPSAKLVVFVPNAATGSSTFTDPSYVMPAFSDVWACFDAKNTGFWQAVSATSRAFFPKATDPTTGLAPERAAFDGTASTTDQKGDFEFDAWRVAMNVMADYRFWAADPWQKTYAARLGAFFASQGNYGDEYTLSGSELDTSHSAGLVAINGLLGAALPAASGKPYVQALWDLGIPTGQFRYYNGMLYMLALLHASGQFHLTF
jgi:oligosaccharide reducing-end xylanase